MTEHAQSVCYFPGDVFGGSMHLRTTRGRKGPPTEVHIMTSEALLPAQSGSSGKAKLLFAGMPATLFPTTARCPSCRPMSVVDVKPYEGGHVRFRDIISDDQSYV